MSENRTNIAIESPGVNVAVLRHAYEGWEFLLLKRSEHETYAGYWGFVYGQRRGSETVGELVRREVREETGLEPESIWATEYVEHYYEPNVDKIWILPLIVAVVPVDAQIVLSDENCEYRWLSASRAQRLLSWKNLVNAIDEITDEIEVFPARNWVQITS